MNNSLKFFAAIGATSLLFSARPVHAQDAPPPPPAGYNYQGAPPPPDQAPPPGYQGAPPPDQGGDQGGDQGASFQQFYDQLGSQGSWVQTNDYGYVFQPNVSDPNWAPYSDGHWVYSNVGWTWVSAEPWGWATYHYGRWANVVGAGWVWVPGYQWAPAWVSWRYGGGYCGWAPLPPATFVGVEYGNPGLAVGVGFHFGGDVDLNFNIGPGCYNFVPVGCMGYGNYNRYYIDRSRNYTVINHTTNITNITINNRGGATGFTHVSNRGPLSGPKLEDINAHSTQRVQTVTLAQSNEPGRANLHGNQLAVYAPHVNAASAREARPAQVGQSINNVAFNHGDSINQPLDVTRNIKGRAASQESIAAAEKASTSAPATAKVAHAGVAKSVDRPLTSMQPISGMQQTHATTTQTESAANNAVARGAFTGEKRKSTTENTPYTGESNANTQHKQAETSPYTGENSGGPVHTPSHSATTTTSPYTGEGVQHSTEHSTVQHSPYTGEPTQQQTHTQQNTANTQEHRQTQQQQQSAPVQHSTPPQGGGTPPQQHYTPQGQGQGGGHQQAGQGNVQGNKQGQNNQNGQGH